MPLIIPVTFLLQSPVPPHPSPRGGEAEPTGMMGCVCVISVFVNLAAVGLGKSGMAAPGSYCSS